MKIYKFLAKNVFSRARCIDSINKNIGNVISNVESWKIWVNKYEEEIDTIMRDIFPHGSGIDSGCMLNYEKSVNNKLVINSGYHCMDDNGCYDGWVDFTVTLTPDLELDYMLNIRGNFGKYRHVKDYLYQIFYDSFDTEYVKGDK